MRPSWNPGVLTLSSRRVRSPAAIVAFAQRALGALGDLTGIEIESVVTRARS